MSDVIDDLKVQIDASTNSADAKIDKFIQKMMSLQSTISGIEMSGASQVASGINQISNSIQNFSSNTKTADFSRITKGLNKLGAVDVQGVSNASRAMSTLSANLSSMGSISFDSQGIINLASSISKLGGKTVTQAVQNIPLLKGSLESFIQTMNGLNSVTFDASGLNSLVGSISKLGSKSAGNAIPNIQALGVALKSMMQTLAGAPQVNNNLIQMTNALAKLASNGSKVSSASHAMTNSLNSYSISAGKAKGSTKGLVSQIGMLYAKYFLLVRGIKGLWKATESSMDYIETLNYFDAAWGQVADNAIGSWKQSGYDSAEAYADSFSKRAQDLTGKMSGFEADDNGNLVSTSMPNLGIDPDKVMNYQATFGQMASSMGAASETALQLSNALTMIGADLASVKNLNFDDVWNDMASGMVGMSRTLDKYGVNIRNVNLQEKLHELGIKTKITALNQQDKALLRTMILLDSTRYAWGDLSSTLGQPANQLRLLQANFVNLARTIGNLFLPIVATVLPYINALVIAVQRLFTWIGSLLGINIGSLGSSIGSAAVDMDGLEDAAGGVADKMGDAADKSKKMASNLQKFDDLNVVSSSDNSSGSDSSGGSGDGGGLLDQAFLDSFSEYQAAWDKAFSNMENSAQNMADKIENAFKRVWEAAEPTREALNRLWNEGFAQLGNFTWTALQDFWSEFLVPLGKWTLGTGLPMLIDYINNFLKTVDFQSINSALKNFWQALEPFAEKVGEGLIRFFGDLSSFGANFINAVVPGGLNGIAEALKKINPDTAEKIGYAIGIVATGIMGFKTISTAYGNLKKVYTPLQKLFALVGPMKYVVIAAGIAGLVVALDKFGVINVNWGSLSNGFKDLASALGKFVKGIGDGLILFIKSITPIVAPALEITINGIGKAFEFLAEVLSKIPSSVISGLTVTFLDFFAIWKTFTFVSKIAETTQHLYNMKDAFLLLGQLQIDGIKQMISGFFGSLAAHPYIAIAAGIAGIALGLSQLYQAALKNPDLDDWVADFENALDKINNKSEASMKKMEELRNSVNDSGESQSLVAEKLAEKYAELHEKSNPTANDIALMKKYSEELVGYYPELEKYFDNDTGLLETNHETIQKVIDKQKELARAKAAMTAMEDAYKEQMDSERNYKEAESMVNEAEDAFESASKKWSDYLKSHPTYAQTGSQDLFEGDPFNVEKNRLQNEITATAKELGKAKQSLQGAQEAVKSSDESIEYFWNVYNDSTLKAAESTEDFKQSVEDIKESFNNLGIAVTDGFVTQISTGGDSTILALQDLFAKMDNGTQIAGQELMNVFKELGIDLPTGLINNLSTKAPEMQEQAVKTLISMKSGIQATEPELTSLFSTLGITLPEETIKSLSGKEAPLQKEVINLLGKIQEGHSATENELNTIFTNLGLDLPNKLVESLASKNGETQQQAVELLSQIKNASDKERESIIENLNKLGIDGADSLGRGIESEQEPVLTKSKKLVNTVKSTFNEELDPNDKNTGSLYAAGANASKGFWQGVKDWWDDTWIGKAIDDFKGKVTGKDGLDEHSPSKTMNQYGAYAIRGFNIGLSDEMPNTMTLLDGWLSKLNSESNGYNLTLPGIEETYTVNREFFDRVDTRATVSYDTPSYDFKAGISTELNSALSGIIDYDRLGNVLAEKLEGAKITAELDSDKAYNNVKDNWNREYSRNKKAPVPI